VRTLGQELRILLREDETVRWPPKDGQPAPTSACDLGRVRQPRSACGNWYFARERAAQRTADVLS